MKTNCESVMKTFNSLQRRNFRCSYQWGFYQHHNYYIRSVTIRFSNLYEVEDVEKHLYVEDLALGKFCSNDTLGSLILLK